MLKKTFSFKYANLSWFGLLEGEVYKFPSNALADGKIVIVDYLPIKIMPRVAKAKLIIVNNATGLLSHALIISREFKIPVIIGTQDFKNINNGKKIKIDIKQGYFIEE